MRRLLLAPAFILTLLVVGILLALALGRAFGRTPRLLAGTDECALPCWNGIHPGETLFARAESILRSQGYRLPRNDEIGYINDAATPVCRVSLSRGRLGDPIVREVSLWFCQPLALGDLIEMFGPPEMLVPYISLMGFQDGEVLVMLETRLCETRLSPHNRVTFLSLAGPGFYASLMEQPERVTWRGFVSTGFYRQFNPGKGIC